MKFIYARFSSFNLKANGYLDCQEMKNMIEILLK